MKLSDVERLTLANQFRILDKLFPTGESYGQCVEILERGYEGLYGRVFQNLSKPVPSQVSDEVFDIFEMFRALEDAYRRGIPKPAFGRPQYTGYDADNDEHYGVARFILRDLKMYQEQRDRPDDSHSRAELPVYRRMLATWKKLGKPLSLGEEQVKQIVDVRGD